MTFSVRRYHLRSLNSYMNLKDLLQNYKKYLWNNNLEDAYYEKFDNDKDMNNAIKKMLLRNFNYKRLIIRDPNVEKWAKENNMMMVNKI